MGQLDLAANSFTIDSKDYHVPCVFQIWEKKSYPRTLPEAPVCQNFLFCKKDQDPDLSIRRVGVKAGTISDHPADKSEQSHYYLQLQVADDIKTELIKYLTDEVSMLEISEENTVGPRSISKPELIHCLNPIIAKYLDEMIGS